MTGARHAILWILILTPLCLGQDVSPTFHTDNQRTGRTSFIGPSSPRLRWTYRTQASVEASPTIGSDGTIYLASTDGLLYALTPSGRLRWVFAAKDSIVSTPAIAPDGAIHFADLEGGYYAVRPDGSLKWSVSLASGDREYRAISSPVIAPDGRSYIGAWNDHFFAFGPDGGLLWQLELPGEGQITAAPALDSAGNVYLATHDPSDKSRIAVYRFAPASSTPVWVFSEGMGIDRNRITSAPVIDTARSRLYICAARDNDGALYAVNLATGKRVFLALLPKGIVGTPAIGWDGMLYVGCLDGKLYCLDSATGAELWSFAADGPYIMASPSIDGAGTIYVGDSDGTLYALSASGKELWRYRTDSNIVSAPVISGTGALYVTSFDCRLHALASGKPISATRR